jgi:flavin reductase ActVB
MIPVTDGSRSHHAEEALKASMGCLATGVVVVTNWVGGRAWGTTVSACCSVSLSPPLLLICLGSGSVAARAIMEQQSFGVNVLAADQVPVATRGAAPGEPKFMDDLVSEDADLGSPILVGVLSSIHCELYNALSVGDHVVLIGEVISAASTARREPLLYHRRTFRQLHPDLESSPAR